MAVHLSGTLDYFPKSTFECECVKTMTSVLQTNLTLELKSLTKSMFNNARKHKLRNNDKCVLTVSTLPTT